MKQKRAEWTYNEWKVPGTWPEEFLPKPRPLTKEEEGLWNRVQKLVREAKKWKKNKNR